MNKHPFRHIVYLLSFIFLVPFTFISSVNAEIISDVADALGKKGKCLGPFCYKDVGTLISNGLQWALIIASLLVVLYLAWGGLQWLTSAGEKGALENAKNRITHALIGLVIIVAAWAIFLILIETLGLPIKTSRSSSSSTTGTGQQGGSGSTSWSCTTQMCDCCNATNNPDCCKTMGKYAPRCIVGRYRNSDAECAKISIDWNICWANEEYSKVSETARQEIATACK